MNECTSYTRTHCAEWMRSMPAIRRCLTFPTSHISHFLVRKTSECVLRIMRKVSDSELTENLLLVCDYLWANIIYFIKTNKIKCFLLSDWCVAVHVCVPRCSGTCMGFHVTLIFRSNWMKMKRNWKGEEKTKNFILSERCFPYSLSVVR